MVPESRVFPVQWDMSGGHNEATTLPVDPVFLLFLPVRSWTRSRSMGSKFISYLMPTLTRTRSSRSRPESWRWERDTQLLLCQTLPSAGLVTDTILFLFIFASLPCLPDTFIFHTSFLWLCFALGIHWRLSDFSRRAFPLLWLAPTSWLRWKERRSVVVCTPGEWLKWRTQSTMTSSNYAPCLCESPWR